MEYFNENEILRYFQKYIEDVSKEQIKKLENEIQSIKDKEMSKIEEDIKLDINNNLGVELEDLKIEHRQKINDIFRNSRRELIQYRESLLNNVITEVTKKLKNYVSTPAYLESMESKLKLIDIKNDAVFYVSNKDQGLKSLIAKMFNNKYETQDDENIRLGGFRVDLKDQGTTLDETIDLKLERKKQWFYKESHLFIEE